MNELNEHHMLTRSKRKRNNINIDTLEELIDIEEENITMNVNKKKKLIMKTMILMNMVMLKI